MYEPKFENATADKLLELYLYRGKLLKTLPLKKWTNSFWSKKLSMHVIYHSKPYLIIGQFIILKILLFTICLDMCFWRSMQNRLENYVQIYTMDTCIHRFAHRYQSTKIYNIYICIHTYPSRAIFPGGSSKSPKHLTAHCLNNDKRWLFKFYFFIKLYVIWAISITQQE